MTPGLKSWCYPSSMVSPYYCWAVDLGFPELDVKRFEDGEFALIEYLNMPIIPSLTKWSYVLTGIRNIDLNQEFIRKYADQLRLDRQGFWDREHAVTAREDERSIKDNEHSEDFTNRALTAIRGNEDLMNRVAKNGLKELALSKIARRISPHNW